MNLDTSTYIQDRVTQEGTYWVRPVAWQVRDELQSGSQPLNVQYAVLSMWLPDNDCWSAEFEPGTYVEGSFWIQTRGGAAGEFAFKRMAELGIWTPGDFEQLEAAPHAVDLDIVVKYDRTGKYLNGDWVDAHADRPSSAGGARIAQSAPGATDSLKAKHGAHLRAMFAAMGAASTPPPAASAPAAPAAPAAPPAPPRPNVSDEDAPF